MKAHYIRISTIEQNEARQQTQDGFDITYTDKCSGTIPLFDRPQGSKLKIAIDKGDIKELFVHSIDRLGRNTLDILSNIQYLTDRGICLTSDKEGIRTFVNGKENPTAKLIINVLATIAEFENDRRKERQLEGIAIAKANGTYKGRSSDTKLTDTQVLEKYDNVVKELKSGESIRRVAKLCSVSVGTVQKVKKLLI